MTFFNACQPTDFTSASVQHQHLKILYIILCLCYRLQYIACLPLSSPNIPLITFCIALSSIFSPLSAPMLTHKPLLPQAECFCKTNSAVNYWQGAVSFWCGQFNKSPVNVCIFLSECCSFVSHFFNKLENTSRGIRLQHMQTSCNRSTQMINNRIWAYTKQNKDFLFKKIKPFHWVGNWINICSIKCNLGK